MIHGLPRGAFTVRVLMQLTVLMMMMKRHAYVAMMQFMHHTSSSSSRRNTEEEDATQTLDITQEGRIMRCRACGPIMSASLSVSLLLLSLTAVSCLRFGCIMVFFDAIDYFVHSSGFVLAYSLSYMCSTHGFPAAMSLQLCLSFCLRSVLPLQAMYNVA